MFGADFAGGAKPQHLVEQRFPKSFAALLRHGDLHHGQGTDAEQGRGEGDMVADGELPIFVGIEDLELVTAAFPGEHVLNLPNRSRSIEGLLAHVETEVQLFRW